MSWQDLARCAETDPEVFFPEQGEASKSRRAKLICSGCEVRAECLAWALEHSVPYGVWGGLTAEERRDAKRQRLAA